MAEIKFGDIYLAELVGTGHQQRGVRAVIIAQNDMGNRFSPTVEIIPLTARIHKDNMLMYDVYLEIIGEK